MPALDDYAAPLPLWLVVCRVLDENPAGLSVTRIAFEVAVALERSSSGASYVAQLLSRMREDGMCTVRVEGRGNRFPSHIHTLTPEGRELYKEAASRLVWALGRTGNHGSKQRQRQRRRQR